MPRSHRNRACFVCGCTVTPGDTLGMGCVRPWQGNRRTRRWDHIEQPFICEGCTSAAARWLSGIPERQAVALIRAARKGAPA